MPADLPATSDDPSGLRRIPSQQRSRERVERILAAAEALIEAQGSDALRMNELAERTGISIGSLYQYFPDKSAIIRTLAERSNAVGRECIARALAGAADPDGLCAAFGELVDQYYAMFLAEPVLRDIWAAMQADKALRAVELAESRANGALLAQALGRLYPHADPRQLTASALLIMQLGEATMRLALAVERAEGDALVAAYKRMAEAELRRPLAAAAHRARSPDRGR